MTRLDNAKYCLCNNVKKFSLKNGNPFNSMAMQASYDDLPKYKKESTKELDTKAVHSSDYTVWKTHLLSNASTI
jgi:hypothetical protein